MIKTRFIIPLIAFAVLAGVLFVAVKRAPDRHFIASVLIGKPAPEFKLPSLTSPGANVTSKSLEGKPYLLNVWGTWCAMCRVEHPALLQIQQLGTLPIIGLNWRDDDAQAIDWLAQLGNPYSQVAVDKQGRLAIDLGVYGAPETFLIDAKGIIVHKHVGPLDMEIWKRDFEPKLAGNAGDAAQSGPTS
jgi:cytochrome c biogenesis protein CcmG/thiol:disulfide interchange protein DsbE